MPFRITSLRVLLVGTSQVSQPIRCGLGHAMKAPMGPQFRGRGLGGPRGKGEVCLLCQCGAPATKDRMAVSRTAFLTHMVAESKKDGPQRSDEAYMQGVTPADQVGQWARLVPAFGTRVKYRRFRLGLMDGSAQVASRRTHKSDSAKGELPADVLDCPTRPTCGFMETGNHVLLHCPKTEAVWGHAIRRALVLVLVTDIGDPAKQGWEGGPR